MLFSKFAIAAVLALASSVASQVIVTVTNTVTVVTVTMTVTPLSTSTKTTYVTVSSPPPQPTITSTVVTVVTVTPPSSTAITTCPIPLYYQCGGQGWTGCTSCTRGAACVSGNPYYYQCQQTSTPQVITITSTIYRG